MTIIVLTICLPFLDLWDWGQTKNTASTEELAIKCKYLHNFDYCQGYYEIRFLYDIEEYWIVEVCTNGLHLLYAKMFNKMFNAIIFSSLIQIKSCVTNLIISFLFALLSFVYLERFSMKGTVYKIHFIWQLSGLVLSLYCVYFDMYIGLCLTLVY